MDGPHSFIYAPYHSFHIIHLLLMAATTMQYPYYLHTNKQTDRQTYSLDLGIYDYSLIVPVSLDFRKRIPSRVPLEPADHANHLS